MRSQQILYHGSPKDLEILIPSPTLYASHVFEFALPFCFTFNKEDVNSSWNIKINSDDILIELENSLLNKEHGGWIYVLSSENFKKINEFEWISNREVNFLKKIKIEPSIINEIVI